MNCDARVAVSLACWSNTAPGDNVPLKSLLKVFRTEHGKPDKPHALKGKEEQMRRALALQTLKGW